jgi:hypothetical protein
VSDTAARAAGAQRLLADPLLKEAFQTIRDEAIRSWENTPARDTDAREIAWLTVKVLGRIEGVLQSAVDDGRIAAARTQAPLR